MIELYFNMDELSPLWARLEEGLGDKAELNQSLGELLVQSTQDRMQRGEQPDGSPFAPRSEATLARYAAKDLSFGAPLNQSGDMRNNIFYEADARSVRWGSNAIQAAVMQFGADKGAFGAAANGSPIPWGRIPARPFLGISEEDEINIAAEAREWLEGLAAGRD